MRIGRAFNLGTPPESAPSKRQPVTDMSRENFSAQEFRRGVLCVIDGFWFGFGIKDAAAQRRLRLLRLKESQRAIARNVGRASWSVRLTASTSLIRRAAQIAPASQLGDAKEPLRFRARSRSNSCSMSCVESSNNSLRVEGQLPVWTARRSMMRFCGFSRKSSRPR